MRIGWMRAVSVWLAAPGLAPAQAPAQAPQSPFAAISGVVLNDATGAPIRRAAITLSTLDTAPLEALTFSEANGVFGFNTIPPGKYRLRVEMSGFQRAWFGAATSTRPPGALKLAPGDVRYGITFRLRPLGSISGVVFDPDGDPVPNAQLRLLKSAWDRLKPSYRYQGFASTDSRGRYRFHDVTPGQYLVMAAQTYTPALTIQPEAAAGQPPPQKMYAVQFYPDASRLASAAPLELAVGQDLEGIEFHLTAQAVAPLHGNVVVPGDLPAGSHVQINVYSQEIPGSAYQSTGSRASPPNFEFQVPNLIAGTYVIVASFSAGGRDFRATERIELPPGGLELTLHPDHGIELAGRVDLEGGSSTGPFQVSLIPGGDPPGRRPIRVEAHADGTFVAADVVPGIWDIGVNPLPRGGYVKAMRLGDRDVLTDDLIVDAGTHEPLHLVVSTRGAVVTGTVTVPPGVARSARAVMLLAPVGKYANVLSFYGRASSDDAGHFEFTGVTPGRYKLYAFEEMDSSAYQDPNFLKPFETLSEPFDVAEGGRVERQTQLILAGTEPAAN
jgi:protocatechuate 3,4-dioxygenase beta subunit